MLKSIWSATANKPHEFPALVGSCKADVVVVGAGYTGLSCALALAEAGANVIVVEAEQPGFGASGRNGGQVIPGLKYDPDKLDRMFGEAATEFVGGAAQHVFDTIEKHDIQCDHRQNGWIQTTVKTSHIPALESRMQQWEKRGAPVEWQDAAQVARQTGSSRFVAGWKDRRAGCLHPLNYARGLATAAANAGVEIYGNSPVSKMQSDGAEWKLSVGAQGEIKSDQVVLATNGYTGGLWPGLRQTMVPANSFQIATTPLPESLSRSLLPEGSVASDSRRLANYFRIGPGNRLMVGGRGHFAEPSGPNSFKRMHADMKALFPSLKNQELEFMWSGRAAMTLDHLPHIYQPASGVTAALGYNGRGLALGSALGAAIGTHLATPSVPLQLPAGPMKQLPFHPMHPYYGTAAIWFYRLRDLLES